jgi:hypothetical protein
VVIAPDKRHAYSPRRLLTYPSLSAAARVDALSAP